jgi:hypothetical protein
MTVTFRDLWLRRQRVARATRFQLMHNLNRALWADDQIEWVKIDTGGLPALQKSSRLYQSWNSELAKRNRLRASKF